MVLVLCAGCGTSLVKVEGEILLDGKPLPGASVMFVPQAGGRPASGKSDVASKFHLTTTNPNDGVAPGQYSISVVALDEKKIKPVAKGDPQLSESELYPSLIPARYNSFNTSGLNADVSAEQPRVKLELNSAP
ncbi:hypothetical protein ETAA8_53370 [Anatilimnocola aggregata]|uniref:DUF2141 domain-containing protein n=1 Tax=Anatilimnocola aggregata TaxID=2528021 RepID=A0A517YJ12_9BACT|nr:hypothetical protein ETAA8_53370 [Anatilimnocola aggregata]